MVGAQTFPVVPLWITWKYTGMLASNDALTLGPVPEISLSEGPTLRSGSRDGPRAATPLAGNRPSRTSSGQRMLLAVLGTLAAGLPPDPAAVATAASVVAATATRSPGEQLKSLHPIPFPD